MKRMIKTLKTLTMKKNLYITASFDKPELVENIAEKLAARRYDSGYAKARVPKKWQAIDTSSVETYVTGNIEIVFDEEPRIRMPFITCFLFSCTKGKNDPYKLDWSISFS